MATSAVDVLQLVEELVLAHRAHMTPDILGVVVNLPLQSEDEHDHVFEDLDLSDRIKALTEVQMLTGKQKMKSRAVEEYENVQRAQIARTKRTQNGCNDLAICRTVNQTLTNSWPLEEEQRSPSESSSSLKCSEVGKVVLSKKTAY